MRFLPLLFLALLLTACSPQNNTASSRWWQAFVTRYNVYYNATEAYRSGTEAQESGLKDDYTQRLPIFSVSYEKQRALGKNHFAAAITKCEKAIQLHSIKRRPEWNPNRRMNERQRVYLSRKEFNPFLKNAWLLMGRAQFQQGDFVAAASTFAYLTRFYAAEAPVAHEARIWLARCYAELGWLYDAEDALNRVGRDSLSPRLSRERDLSMASFLIRQERLDAAVPYLQSAAQHAPTRLQRARLYYLLSQVFQQLQQTEAAYRALGRCLSLSPNYTLTLHARVLQTEVAGRRQSSSAKLAQLHRMAKDGKNQEYLALIYYAMGNLYLAKGDEKTATTTYETGRYRSLQATPEKGQLLVKLGDLYWKAARYDKAQSCYTEAIGLLDKNRNDHASLMRRSEQLDQLAPAYRVIFEQDSLLALVAAPEAQRWTVIDRFVQQAKRQAAEQQRLKADSALAARRQREGEEGNNDENEAPRPNPIANNSQSQWYFYNPTVVAQGKQSFIKQWGNRRNEDDWRRSNRSLVAQHSADSYDYAADDSINALVAARRDSLTVLGLEEREIRRQLRAYAELLSQSGTTTTDEAPAAQRNTQAENDPTRREFYLAQLPFSPEAQQAAHQQLQRALYDVAVIFKDKVEDFGLAQQYFDRIERDYPQHERMSEVLYQQFLLARRRGHADQMAHYRARLQQYFPQDHHTQLIADPDFERKAQWARELEDSLYTATYAAYTEGRNATVASNVAQSATAYPNGANRPKFWLLGDLARLGSAPRDSIIASLKQLLTAYPQHEVSEMAAMIVRGLSEGRPIRSSAHSLGDLWARRIEDVRTTLAADGGERQLKADKNVPFVLLISYEQGKVQDDQLLYEIARFNFSRFTARGFDIEKLQSGKTIQFRLTGFRSFTDVHAYAQHLYADSALANPLRKTELTLISAANLRLLGAVVSLEDYRSFYQQHYAPFKLKRTLPLDFEPDSKDRPRQIYEDELPDSSSTRNNAPSSSSSDDEDTYYEDSTEYYDE